MAGGPVGISCPFCCWRSQEQPETMTKCVSNGFQVFHVELPGNEKMSALMLSKAKVGGVLFLPPNSVFGGKMLVSL